MIDYSAGFVRRGLLGELLRRAARDSFHLQVLLTVSALMFAFLALFILVDRLLANRFATPFHALLVISPAVMLQAVNTNYALRKEVFSSCSLRLSCCRVHLFDTKLYRRGFLSQGSRWLCSFTRAYFLDLGFWA